MKKPFKFLFLAFTVLLFLLASSATKMSIIPGIMHRNDYYAVSFDGEGDAIVRAKFSLVNHGKESINQIRFQLPQNALVYFVARCPATWGTYYYDKSDYYDYKKLDFNMERYADSLNVRVFLSEELKPNTSVEIFMLYKVSALAKKDFLGNFNFEFKTAIDTDAVLTEEVRVAVNTQPGFVLKGAKSEVNYKQDFFSEAAAVKVAQEFPVAKPGYYDNYYNIEYVQGLVKEAYSLDQYESFTVRGSYSENGLILYLPEILIGILVLAIIFGVIAFAIKRFAKKALQTKAKVKDDVLPKQPIKELIVETYKSTFATVILTALAIAGLVIITVFVSAAFMDAIWRIGLIDYSYKGVLLLIYMVIVASFVILEFALPSYFVYKKHSLIAGLATFLLSLLFIFIIVFAIGVLMKAGRTVYY
ncbi:MAG: hypothetical protein N3F05_04620 [Candidatus Diapherotrites archaeon]|nr:hypothetical protein [Candidatus Diapherotrites archaeon]